MLAVTGVWAFVLLNRTPDWLPALRWIVLVGSVIVAAVVAVGPAPTGPRTVVVWPPPPLFGLGSTRGLLDRDHVVHAHSGPMTMSGPQAVRRLRRPAGKPGQWARWTGDDAALEALVKRVDNRWAAATVGSFHGERPGAEDRGVAHGDRRLQRR